VSAPETWTFLKQLAEEPREVTSIKEILFPGELRPADAALLLKTAESLRNLSPVLEALLRSGKP
jgi:hypothetical protein